MTDEETALAGIAAMEVFYHEIGMPTSLTELGIAPTDEQIRKMAADAVTANGGPLGSAKILQAEDAAAILMAGGDKRFDGHIMVYSLKHPFLQYKPMPKDQPEIVANVADLLDLMSVGMKEQSVGNDAAPAK